MSSRWRILAAVSIVCIPISIALFPIAHPFLSSNVRLNRSSAVAAAYDFAAAIDMGNISDVNDAVIIESNDSLRNYIGLMAGGKTAISKLIKDEQFDLHRWKVRLFSLGDSDELTVWFDLAGQPLAMVRKATTGEDGSGTSATTIEPHIAEKVRELFDIDLADYELERQESSSSSTGVMMQSYWFKSLNELIPGAEQMLEIAIRGRELVKFSQYTRLPGGFIDEYESRHALNDRITNITLIFVILLYAGAGLVGGLIFSIRQRYLMWKKPLIVAAAMSCLQLLLLLNHVSAKWMTFDAAGSNLSFPLDWLMTIMPRLLLGTAALTLLFMVAESMSRKAFGDHLQFWNIFTPDYGATKEVLEQVSIGYLFSIIYFALYLGLSVFTTRYLGWWLPSEIDPQILAWPFPSFDSFPGALSTAMVEETLFRAIPLAGAALIGEKLKRRKLMLGVGLVVQTLLFCLIHASHAQQPFCARLVAELIIPTVVVGFLFVRYGLLPGMVLHYSAIVIWIGAPVLISSAPGMWVHKAVILLTMLIPLGLVLFARLRQGHWSDAPQSFYNRSWTPTTKTT